MLFSIDGGSPKPITRLPHEKDFKIWRGRLPDAEYQAIVDELRHRIEGGEVHTSSWLPGANWEGTVFHPIFKTACRGNYDRSSLFFGLIVWKMFMDHEDDWSFGRYEKDGEQIRGITYFRINL